MEATKTERESARVDLTPEAIRHLKGIAQAATQDEWIMLASPYFENEGAYLITTNGREEAGLESIAKVFGGDPRETAPSDFMQEQRANAVHIAAFQPAVALALCNRIENLRKANAVVASVCQTVKIALRVLEADRARLEREAQWLARSAANNGWNGVRVSPEFMRDQARQAVSADKE